MSEEVIFDLDKAHKASNKAIEAFVGLPSAEAFYVLAQIQYSVYAGTYSTIHGK